jgi:hypothetical protein
MYEGRKLLRGFERATANDAIAPLERRESAAKREKNLIVNPWPVHNDDRTNEVLNGV